MKTAALPVSLLLALGVLAGPTLAQEDDTDAEIDAAARSLSDWAARQRRWLSNHPPRPCYKAVHKEWRKSVVDVKRGSGSLHQAITKARWTDVVPAVQQVGAGLTRAANVDLKVATERCADAS